MWAVAAQPRTGLTPMMPTPSVDSGIARADLTSKLLLRAVDESALCQGSPSPGVIGTTASWTGMDRSTGEYGIRRYAKDSRMSGAHHRADPGVLDQDNLRLRRFDLGGQWWIPPSARARSR